MKNEKALLPIDLNESGISFSIYMESSWITRYHYNLTRLLYIVSFSILLVLLSSFEVVNQQQAQKVLNILGHAAVRKPG